MKDPFSAITTLIIDKKNIHKLRGEELLRTYASQNSNMYIPFFPSAPQALSLSDKIQSAVQDRRAESLGYRMEAQRIKDNEQRLYPTKECRALW